MGIHVHRLKEFEDREVEYRRLIGKRTTLVQRLRRKADDKARTAALKEIAAPKKDTYHQRAKIADAITKPSLGPLALSALEEGRPGHRPLSVAEFEKTCRPKPFM